METTAIMEIMGTTMVIMVVLYGLTVSNVAKLNIINYRK